MVNPTTENAPVKSGKLDSTASFKGLPQKYNIQLQRA